MNQYVLGDIFIGKFAMYQGFSDKPEIYSSRYPIRGHNGIDFDCPTLTMVLSAAPGKVIAAGSGDTFDSGGYGNYVKILHDGFLTLYAHLNDVVVNSGDFVAQGQLIGHSNNTGNSDFPHLHFALAPVDDQGNKLQPDNGYGGYIDPHGDNIIWDIKNITEPVVPQNEITPQIPVDSKEFSEKSQAFINLSSIIEFSKHNGLVGISPEDPRAAEIVNSWIADLLFTIQQQKFSNNPGQTISNNDVKIDFSQEEDLNDPKVLFAEDPYRFKFFKKLGIAIHGFIWVS